MARKPNPAIRDYILQHVEEYPTAIGSKVAEAFKLSRTSVSKYMQRLVTEGILSAEGNTRARVYKWRNLADILFILRLTPAIEEHVIWQHRVLPRLAPLPQNILNICQYGFTEILNNAIDHSESWEASVSVQQTQRYIEISIWDKGIGIFQKIQRDFQLPDARSALLELSKGKLTSDKKNHAGEGIFFTSRMFDEFYILSGTLLYHRLRHIDNEWLVESKDTGNDEPGTWVRMRIAIDAPQTTAGIFAQYQHHSGFRKTHVPVSLGAYPGEQLVSRSQAKRILARFENFSEILLDFDGVATIGQAFADEIFRVFPGYHPEINIHYDNATQEVQSMIDYVTASRPD